MPSINLLLAAVYTIVGNPDLITQRRWRIIDLSMASSSLRYFIATNPFCFAYVLTAISTASQSLKVSLTFNVEFVLFVLTLSSLLGNLLASPIISRSIPACIFDDD